VLSSIVELAEWLRARGARVSPAEVTDAVEAAAAVGVAEREDLRAALRATLAKRPRDAADLDAVFDLWAGALGRAVAGAGRGLLAALREAGLAGADLARVEEALAALLPGLGPLARAAVEGDPGALARLLADAAARVDLAGSADAAAASFQARRLLSAAGGAAAAAELAGASAALREAGLGPEALAAADAALAAALRRLDEAARRLADAHAAGRTPPVAALARRGVSGEEVARAEAAVRRLAARLRARLSRRERARRGALAVRRTLRRNLGAGGVPLRLAFERRRRHRPEVIVLCDVSESVRHVARLMLLFLYALQAHVARVRTFVFVAELAEVTDRLRGERDPARAASLAVAARAVPLSANSDYGRVLRAFHARHLAAVTRRTTVLVIGDGRTNGHAPEDRVLDDLRRRARRLLWICTEDRSTWSTGDSEMARYAARCHRVATAGSLEELEALADALVPGGG
jgi:uncharacterized protein with von Willebrand factor type A (vWA) domain